MKCIFCKRELKSITAVKLGYGPVCAKKHKSTIATIDESEGVVEDPDSNKYMVI